MRVPVCLTCRQVIPSDDVNVARDIAYCRACNLLHELRTLTDGAELEALGGSPPPETWHRRAETETVIGALHYSPVIFGVSLVLGLAWSAGLFPVAKALRHGLAYNAGLRVNDGHPASRVIAYTSTGEDVIASLAFLAFVLAGCLLLGGFLSCIAGQTRITIRGTHAEIFVGVGRLGRRLRFEAGDVTNVRIVQESRGKGGSVPLIAIELSNGRRLKFGILLPEERLRYLAGALHDALMG